MKTITLTPMQQSIIIDALRDRISKLYAMATSYRGNNEAARDCLEEKRKVQDTLAEFRKQTNL